MITRSTKPIKVNPCKSCGSKYHTRMKCPELLREKLLKSKQEVKNSTKTSTIKQLKRSKSTYKSAKDKAWKAFAYYIRLRDSVNTTGSITHCICITCEQRGDSSYKTFSHIQAGHAVGGRGNAVLFNEDIVNGQCDYCNRKPPMGLGGDYGNYSIALIKRHGIEYVEELQSMKNLTVKYKVSDLKSIESKYKQKVKEILDSI